MSVYTMVISALRRANDFKGALQTLTDMRRGRKTGALSSGIQTHGYMDGWMDWGDEIDGHELNVLSYTKLIQALVDGV